MIYISLRHDYIHVDGYVGGFLARCNCRRRRFDAQRTAGSAESGRTAGASVRVGRGIPGVRPAARHGVPDCGYSNVGHVRIGIAGQAECRAVTDPDDLHHGAWRRTHAHAGIESRRGGVPGKAFRRGSSAGQRASSLGELTPRGTRAAGWRSSVEAFERSGNGDRHFNERSFEQVIGSSAALESVLEQVQRVAPTDATVLVQGETGTGKELIARAIHNLSSRCGRAFVKLNCAAIPLDLLESELFGHEKGAFTGAIAQKIGRFELANGGTLFLDEVGDIPPVLQPKLLRAGRQ